MYKFRITEPFPCSAKETFEVTTKEFEPLAKYVPNVTKIKVLEHETLEDGRVRWLMHFYGDGAIPALVRPVIKPDMLRWKEEMICNPEDLTIEWRIITDHFTESFHCSGITHNKDTGSGSQIIIDGKMEVNIKHIPGFPDKLVEKAVQLFEPFVGKLIAPNIRQFYQAIKKKMKADEKEK